MACWLRTKVSDSEMLFHQRSCPKVKRDRSKALCELGFCIMVILNQKVITNILCFEDNCKGQESKQVSLPE